MVLGTLAKVVRSRYCGKDISDRADIIVHRSFNFAAQRTLTTNLIVDTGLLSPP